LPPRPPLLALAGTLAVISSGGGASLGAAAGTAIAGGPSTGTVIAVSVATTLTGFAAGVVGRRRRDVAALARLDGMLSDALDPRARATPPVPPPRGSAPQDRPAPRPLAVILATPRAAPRRRRRAPVAAPRPTLVDDPELTPPGTLVRPPTAPSLEVELRELVEGQAGDIAGLPPRQAPPAGMTAAQGGALRLRAVTVDQVAAGWLKLVADGVLRVGTTRKGHISLEPGTPVAAGEGWPGAAMAQVFDGRDHVRLYGYDRRILEASRGLSDELSAWLEERQGPWGTLPWAFSPQVLTVSGLVAALVALGMPGMAHQATEGGGLFSVALAALVIGGALGVVSGGPALQPATPAGYAAWLPVEAHRRWLAAAGPVEVAAVARDGRLAEATTWAVALGCRDRWSQAVRAAGPDVDAGQREAALLALRLAGELHLIVG
jgi:hypothetical protein